MATNKLLVIDSHIASLSFFKSTFMHNNNT